MKATKNIVILFIANIVLLACSNDQAAPQARQSRALQTKDGNSFNNSADQNNPNNWMNYRDNWATDSNWANPYNPNGNGGYDDKQNKATIVDDKGGFDWEEQSEDYGNPEVLFISSNGAVGFDYLKNDKSAYRQHLEAQKSKGEDGLDLGTIELDAPPEHTGFDLIPKGRAKQVQILRLANGKLVVFYIDPADGYIKYIKQKKALSNTWETTYKNAKKIYKADFFLPYLNMEETIEIEYAVEGKSFYRIFLTDEEEMVFTTPKEFTVKDPNVINNRINLMQDGMEVDGVFIVTYQDMQTSEDEEEGLALLDFDPFGSDSGGDGDGSSSSAANSGSGDDSSGDGDGDPNGKKVAANLEPVEEDGIDRGGIFRSDWNDARKRSRTARICAKGLMLFTAAWGIRSSFIFLKAKFGIGALASGAIVTGTTLGVIHLAGASTTQTGKDGNSRTAKDTAFHGMLAIEGIFAALCDSLIIPMVIGFVEWLTDF